LGAIDLKKTFAACDELWSQANFGRSTSSGFQTVITQTLANFWWIFKSIFTTLNY